MEMMSSLLCLFIIERKREEGEERGKGGEGEGKRRRGGRREERERGEGGKRRRKREERVNSRLNERPLYQFVRLLVSDEERFRTMEDVDKYRLFCFDKGGPLIIDKRHHSLKVKKKKYIIFSTTHHKTTPFPLLIPLWLPFQTTPLSHFLSHL